MTRQAIIPTDVKEAAEALNMSPGIVSGGHLFLTGVTGSGPKGEMPNETETQFRNAFKKIGLVLDTAGVDFDAVVEMTSYHIGLRQHFDLFDKVRSEVFTAPTPAWTAIEAAGLRRKGAVVEIRVIAYIGTET